MNEHDDLVSRLADAARRRVDPMPADTVDLLEQRLLAVAGDDRTITPVALPPRNNRRRAVLVIAAAIGTAAAAVAIAVAVTGSPDRSLTPAGSGQPQPAGSAATTIAGSGVPTTPITAPTVGSATEPPTTLGTTTSLDSVPASSAPSSTERPQVTTPATGSATPGTRPAPTTVVVPPAAATTTVPAPSTTVAREPLPAPTLTLSASRAGGTITFTWTRVGADGFGQYVLARVPAGGISTWPSGMARVVARVRFAVRGSATVDVPPGEERSFLLIALNGDQRVIAVSNVVTVPG